MISNKNLCQFIEWLNEKSTNIFQTNNNLWIIYHENKLYFFNKYIFDIEQKIPSLKWNYDINYSEIKDTIPVSYDNIIDGNYSYIIHINTNEEINYTYKKSNSLKHIFKLGNLSKYIPKICDQKTGTKCVVNFIFNLF